MDEEFYEPRRTANGRFARGSTGNPKGRPLKRVRGYTQREFHQDVLDATEKLVDVDGEKVPALRVLMAQIMDLALAGDRQFMKLLLELRKEAQLYNQAVGGAAAEIENTDKREPTEKGWKEFRALQNELRMLSRVI